MLTLLPRLRRQRQSTELKDKPTQRHASTVNEALLITQPNWLLLLHDLQEARLIGDPRVGLGQLLLRCGQLLLLGNGEALFL
jgi:hypothetical protein